jgi:hypothetical protein
VRTYAERIDGKKKAGIGLGYEQKVRDGLSVFADADAWYDRSGLDYSAVGGLRWRW